MKPNRFILFLVATVVLVFTRGVFAQSAANLSGRVADPSGAVVSGAHVLCTNSNTGITRNATTDAEGLFRFPDLPVGSYNLAVSHAGFTTTSQQGIVLVTGHDVDIPVKLQVGKTMQTVEVLGTNQEVQPTTSVIQTSIENKSITELPLNGRNALQLVFLVPGTINLGGTPSFQSENATLVVNGNRATDNNYELDGVEYLDTNQNTAPVLPSPDAIQEFTAKTSNFGANVRGAGGSINFTTKSGTNQFHGAAFEYIRNDFFDARNYFSTAVTPFKRNQFGGVLGGPIFRNKTFFFFSYQRTRTLGGASPTVIQVPSQAVRSGNFSGTGNTIVDPSTGQPFPGDTIPTTSFDPIATQLLKYFPSANLSNGTYVYSRNDQTDNQYLGRIDHQLTTKDHLDARFFYDTFTFQIPQSLPAFYSTVKFTNRNALLSDTHIFTPNLVLNAKFGYTTASTVEEGITPVTMQQLGAKVPPGFTGAEAEPVTEVLINGFAAPFNNGAQHIFPKNYDYRVNVSWSHGNHFLQFGLDVLRDDELSSANSQALGQWTFDGSRTASNSIANSGNAFADFLLGLPFNFLQKGSVPQAIHNTEVEPWIEDDWRILPRLTLNLGVRWQPWFPAVDEEAPQVGFEPGVQSTEAPFAPLGLVFSGDNHLPHAIFSTDWNNVAPRIGFAYDVNGNARTVVRGAYGIFYRPSPLNLQRFSGNTAAFRSLTASISDPPSTEAPFADTPGGSPFPFNAPSDLKTYQFITPVTTSALIPHSPTSYVQEWNLTVERQVTRHMGVSATYVGNHMIYGMDATEGNPATYIPGQSTQKNVNSRRPFKGLASLEILAPFQFSNYNGLQLSMTQRGGNGLTLISNYTWSKCMDNDSQSTGTVSVINKFDLNANYARCDYDIEHVGNISVVYDLPPAPQFRGLADRMLNHWQISTILGLSSGPVYSVYSGVANSLTGPTTNSGTNDLADRVPGTSTARPAGASKLQEYFNTAAFTTNALGTFGDSGRNSMTGPGAWTWDLGVVKSFPITSRVAFRLRGEAFNVLNHTNFSLPVAKFTNNSFGEILSAGDPRVLQLAGRITF